MYKSYSKFYLKYPCWFILSSKYCCFTKCIRLNIEQDNKLLDKFPQNLQYKKSTWSFMRRLWWHRAEIWGLVTCISTLTLKSWSIRCWLAIVSKTFIINSIISRLYFIAKRLSVSPTNVVRWLKIMYWNYFCQHQLQETFKTLFKALQQN